MDAKRHQDNDCISQWHENFLSAMMEIWHGTTILSEMGDVDVPVGGFIIFSGSKANVGMSLGFRVILSLTL